MPPNMRSAEPLNFANKKVISFSQSQDEDFPLMLDNAAFEPKSPEILAIEQQPPSPDVGSGIEENTQPILPEGGIQWGRAVCKWRSPSNLFYLAYLALDREHKRWRMLMNST